MATNKKIAAVVGVLCEAFNRKPTAATYKAYELALNNVSDELLDVAAGASLASPREFMPTPGQLRELAVTGGIGYEARAERAWLEFDRAVSHHGCDHSVSFADGLINATVRTLGDWVFCCGRTGEDYSVWLRKQFLETYKRLCVTGANETLRAPLMGNLWRENAEYPDELLKKLPGLNAGQVQEVDTKQPVLLPPSEAPKRIAVNAAELPRLELKKA
jgi:hypothetical protein